MDFMINDTLMKNYNGYENKQEAIKEMLKDYGVNER